MGVNKKEKVAASKKAATGPSISNITKVKGVNFYRDAKKVKRLNMLTSGKAKRDRDGNIIKEAAFQSKLPSGTVARVAPNRKWFENTRTISQKNLEAFRTAMAEKQNDPYQFILNQNKLPLSLIYDQQKNSKMHMLETETFTNTFGPKAQRKRAKLSYGSIEELASHVDNSLVSYDMNKDPSLMAKKHLDSIEEARDPIFLKGQSKRIWNELYKVIDSSDVVIHVLDARDPLGTRCKNVEVYLEKEAKHKHLIFVLNKCDLVPTWVTAKWVRILSQEHPTLAFHASINNSFGKGSLIQLLRQFSKLHSDKKQISVGFIGYPNTGKSSIINTLRKKKVCNVAPVPGETKIWQYITLMKRIYLIDCPGIVYPSPEDTDSDIILKGVVRVENIKNPEDHIPALMNRVKREYLKRTYEVDCEDWNDHIEFLEKVAKKYGKLLRGGEADLHIISKMILNDWLRGQIPFFVPPPEVDEDKLKESKNTVEQIFSKIPVAANFTAMDLKGEEATEEDLMEDKPKTVEQQEEEEVNAISEDEEEEEKKDENVTDWDEVFGTVVGEEEIEVKAPVIEGEEEGETKEEEINEIEEEPQEDVEDKKRAKRRKMKVGFVEQEKDQEFEVRVRESKYKKQEKAPRLTTNKRKIGEHYYEYANVKNKNRNKVKPVSNRALTKKLQNNISIDKKHSRK
ncbi:NGP1NT-domain-containing protein [Piromyces finnis]|uniref:Nucleolar GTP-binding protein 2 n=1 Tax=Piromyces finnis TaxID=1754191 RepID=A0A1Y1V8X7_9FUNG|nr:NGP1NT-domain-containing protein [Piromyces finnis]|eukprot:ORX50037.1 NGP1NT-domain-containing protein [Piromyces finnis]